MGLPLKFSLATLEVICLTNLQGTSLRRASYKESAVELTTNLNQFWMNVNLLYFDVFIIVISTTINTFSIFIFILLSFLVRKLCNIEELRWSSCIVGSHRWVVLLSDQVSLIYFLTLTPFLFTALFYLSLSLSLFICLSVSYSLSLSLSIYIYIYIYIYQSPTIQWC